MWPCLDFGHTVADPSALKEGRIVVVVVGEGVGGSVRVGHVLLQYGGGGRVKRF